MRFTTKTPHVEQKWANDFVLELRLRDVPGSVIGAALAEVDAHCADARQGAREAFGDPRVYAQSLEFAPDAAGHGSVVALTRRRLAGTVVASGVGVLGMLATLWGDFGLRHDRGVAITVGMLVTLGILLACFVGLVLAFDAVVAAVARRPLVVVSVMVGFMLMWVAFLVFLPMEIGVLPAPPTIGVGVVLLVISALAQYRDARVTADPVTGPREIDGLGGDARPQSPRTAALLAALLLPVATLVFWVVNRLLGV